MTITTTTILRESLKTIDVLVKISHIISIHISNLKNLLSIRSENSTIDYLNKDEINYDPLYMYRITYKLSICHNYAYCL